MAKQEYKQLPKRAEIRSATEHFADTIKTSLGLDLFKGLGLTIKEFFSPNVTIHYPMEQLPLSPRYRAVHNLQRLLDSGSERCIGCGLCEKICTSNCIRIITHKGEDNRKKIDSYTINLGRCIYCGLCAEVCPELAIVMGNRFENASTQRSQYGSKSEFLTSEKDAKDCSHNEFLGFGSVSPNYNERITATPLDYTTEPKEEVSTQESAKTEEKIAKNTPQAPKTEEKSQETPIQDIENNKGDA
ncbi:NADH-quinone oxidoreductase subunit NuoI [Helicobacter cetorum]|uniref:NADH-quinone oxidoreductase subunit NuoI n=1 Tax=Helicobacter cetorum TaxID=138563 RepID=UPI000CF08CEF|nr:NADH-quinone oxidoreductase subunit NuoI [Helicobacter cetorum]